MAKDKDWLVRSEESVAGIGSPGDNKRIDFYLEPKNKEYTDLIVGLEVKWIPKKIQRKKKKIGLDNDLEKLKIFREIHLDKIIYTYMILAGVHRYNDNNEIITPDFQTTKLLDIQIYYQSVYIPKSKQTSYGVTILKIQ